MGEAEPDLPPTVQTLRKEIDSLTMRLAAAEKRGDEGEMKYVKLAARLEELQKELEARVESPAPEAVEPADPDLGAEEEVEDDRTEEDEDWGFM